MSENYGFKFGLMRTVLENTSRGNISYNVNFVHHDNLVAETHKVLSSEKNLQEKDSPKKKGLLFIVRGGGTAKIWKLSRICCRSN